ncbi:SAV_915 family protein [Saccharopolyspora griseoalba]|uniref:SAV_915 family protein n=1 Tax=Saccharopolyspora griseoalba TaxID=1431848 RepID=A0ABW2LPX5_9PSEU
MLDPDETWHMPAQVYLAARPDSASGSLMFELREWNDQPVVLAYSSIDRFLDGCGADQPWVLLSASRLAELATSESSGAGFKFSVLLDVPLSADLRGTAGGMAEEEPAWNNPDSPDWAMTYIASRPFRPGHEQAALELQPMPGDRLAVMAYSSVRSLQDACGPHQHWVGIPAGLVGEARRQSGADTIALDTPLPDHLRHDTAEE